MSTHPRLAAMSNADMPLFFAAFTPFAPPASNSSTLFLSPVSVARNNGVALSCLLSWKAKHRPESRSVAFQSSNNETTAAPPSCAAKWIAAA